MLELSYFNSDIYVFLGVVTVPIALAVRMITFRTVHKSLKILFVGTVYISIATFVDYLTGTPLRPAFLASIPTEKWELFIAVGFYLPSALIIGWGVYSWFPIFKALEDEIAGRVEAEKKQRELSERLGRTLEDVEKASLAKSEFLASMSHEFRTPLNAIIGFSEALNMGVFGKLEHPKQNETVSLIHESGNHLLNIVNDILDLSKIESGNAKIRESEVDLAEIFADCEAMFEVQARTKNIAMDWSVPALVPYLYADARIVKQIIINLVSNATKFTDAGGEVLVSSSLSLDEEIAIRVEDTGTGMSEDEVKVALESYGQAGSAVASGQDGTGLGLPLVRSFSELHQARFDLKSEPGVGTVVTVTFPSERTLLSGGM